MGFSAKQVHTLQRALNAAYVRTRTTSTGKELSYIEGWRAIAEANRIFGFDSWSRETLEARCVLAREAKGTFYAVYTSKVRITVNADGQMIVRDGQGSGEARGSSPGEAHDVALKTAETDATKRALATFGAPFGLSLYLGGPTKKSGRQSVRPAIPSKSPLSRAAHETSDADATSTPKNSEDNAELAKTPSPELADTNWDNVTNTTPRTASPQLADLQTLSDHLHHSNSSGPALKGMDKSELALPLPRRYRDRDHLRYVASQPCLICSRTPSDAHHVRFAQPKGLGLKSSDEFTVPLCRIHHRQLHDGGSEIAWWNDMDVDPLPIAEGLWQESLRKRRSA